MTLTYNTYNFYLLYFVSFIVYLYSLIAQFVDIVNSGQKNLDTTSEQISQFWYGVEAWYFYGWIFRTSDISQLLFKPALPPETINVT